MNVVSWRTKRVLEEIWIWTSMWTWIGNIPRGSHFHTCSPAGLAILRGAFRNWDLVYRSRSLSVDLWMLDPAPRSCSPVSLFIWYEQPLPSALFGMRWPCLPYQDELKASETTSRNKSCLFLVLQAKGMGFSYWYCIDSLNVRNIPHSYMMPMIREPECRISKLLWNNSVNPKLFIVK